MFRIDRSVVREATGNQAYVVLRVPETAPAPSQSADQTPASLEASQNAKVEQQRKQEKAALDEQAFMALLSSMGIMPAQQQEQDSQVQDALQDARKLLGAAKTLMDEAREREEKTTQALEEARQQRQQAQQLEQQAQQVLQQAQEQAQQLEQQAQVQAEQLQQQGYQHGLEAGRQEALTLEEKQRSEALQWFQSIAQSLEGSLDGMINKLESDVLDLSLDMAGKILGMELLVNDEAYPSMVRYGLNKLRDKQQIVVRVNPQDYERFFQGQAPWLGGPMQKVSISPDEQLAQGEVIAECEGERLDLGANTQIRMMGDTLRPMRGTGIVEGDAHEQ